MPSTPFGSTTLYCGVPCRNIGYLKETYGKKPLKALTWFKYEDNIITGKILVQIEFN